MEAPDYDQQIQNIIRRMEIAKNQEQQFLAAALEHLERARHIRMFGGMAISQHQMRTGMMPT